MKYFKLTMALIWVLAGCSLGFSQTLIRTQGGSSKVTRTPQPKGTTSSNKVAGTYRVTYSRIGGAIEGDEFYGTMGVYLTSNTRSGKASIKPAGNKPNRVLDIPKGRPAKLRALGRTLPASHLISITPSGVKSQRYAKGFTHSYTVDRVREFRLAGEAANATATFDFQFNLTDKRFYGEVGKWERVKVKVSDLKLGKEYVFYSMDKKSSHGGICFKVEKIR